tara:strand:+ start:55 stop:1035 length:981 start_codon:yes stop_codon:yes gene_type:complete
VNVALVKGMYIYMDNRIISITKLEDEVRKYINTTRYQNNLIKDGNNWNQICCSLDTIGDTLYAIDSYVKTEFPSDLGLKYIYIYGLQQALFIQQDAIKHLSEAFKIDYSHSDKVNEIRNFRNASIGHPTKQDRIKGEAKKVYYNYLSRPSLSKDGFSLMRCSDGDTNFEKINILDVISSHFNEIEKAYKLIVKVLKEADRMHKEKFKDKLLVDIFHSSLGYYFEKIAQGIYSPEGSNVEFAISMLDIVIETYSKFEVALQERGDIESCTQHDLDGYNHALSKLNIYLKNQDSSMTEKDALIYLYYIRKNNKDFEQIANEIDQSYLE